MKNKTLIFLIILSIVTLFVIKAFNDYKKRRERSMAVDIGDQYCGGSFNRIVTYEECIKIRGANGTKYRGNR